ncbi:MAG: aspartyl/asparaginyl beta-hydroxylase domain-containing protein [Moraxellaceae bacterium]
MRTPFFSVFPYFNSQQMPYAGMQPPFYDSGSIPAVSILEAGSDIIMAELMRNLGSEENAEICFRKRSLRRQKSWRQIELKVYGVEYEERVGLFPDTMRIMDGIEGVSTVYFSLLAPGAEIKPHTGDTDAYFRIHLGLKIPDLLPVCGIEVAGLRRSWEEGRCIAFNDAYCHAAWNRSQSERIVLIVDVLRPEFQHRRVFVESGVRATLYHSRLYEIFFPVIELFPRALTRLGRPTFHLFSYLYHSARHWIISRSGGEERV